MKMLDHARNDEIAISILAGSGRIPSGVWTGAIRMRRLLKLIQAAKESRNLRKPTSPGDFVRCRLVVLGE
jgi:hypothetical protein